LGYERLLWGLNTSYPTKECVNVLTAVSLNLCPKNISGPMVCLNDEKDERAFIIQKRHQIGLWALMLFKSEMYARTVIMEYCQNLIVTF